MTISQSTLPAVHVCGAMSLDNLEPSLRVGCSYSNASTQGIMVFGVGIKQSIAFLLRRVNPNSYPTTKLNGRELYGTRFYSDFEWSRTLSTTYSNNYSSNFLRLSQYANPICIKSLDDECNLEILECQWPQPMPYSRELTNCSEDWDAQPFHFYSITNFIVPKTSNEFLEPRIDGENRLY